MTSIVIDNFMADPDSVRSFALKQQFFADNRYFRGHRSTSKHLWPDLRERLESILGKRIARNWHSHTTNGVFQFCVGGDQLVYHSDLNTHAAILYLTPDAPPETGTTLYRSKASGGRTVEEVLAKSKLGPEHALATTRVFYGDKLLDVTAWEQVDVIGNRYNRLAVWDARLVHAASAYFGSTKENGRLFQMFFFDVE